MQVSQQRDTITHAVIGQQESVSMGMSDDAALMHILSSTLYTYPRLAAVREPICNGWDAHISAGLTDVPLEITITDTQFTVRDFGEGIPHADIGRIYGVYGNSTKRDDETVTGGFGLGSKSPFAYTDNFEVISRNQGVMTVYRVSKSSMEKGGKPSIDKILAVPTTEQGISVSFGLREDHSHKFMQLVNEVLMLGGIKAKINNGDVVDHIPLDKSPTGYVITEFMGTHQDVMLVRYGNVVYPLPYHEEYRQAYGIIKDVVSRVGLKNRIIFMAPPNSVSIAPSREALILTDATVRTINGLLAVFDRTVTKTNVQAASEICRHLIKKHIKAEPPIIETENIVKDISVDISAYVKTMGEGISYSFSVKRAHLNSLIREQRRVDSGQLMVDRIKKAITDGYIPFKFGHKLLKVHGSAESGMHSEDGWGGKGRYTPTFHRYITLPLYKLVDAHPKMSRERLFFAEPNGRYGAPNLYNLKSVRARNLIDTASFANKRVLLVRGASAATKYFRDNFYSDEFGKLGWIVYYCTNHEKTQEAVQAAFESIGYKVVKYIPKLETILDTLTGQQVPVKKPSVKRKGYPTLAGSVDGNHYLLSVARNNKSMNVVDPVAWVILNNRQQGANKFARLSTSFCKMAAKQFGDRVAVVTPTQADILKVKGVPNVKEFIMGYVDAELSAQPDFPRYLAFGKHTSSDDYHDDQATQRRRNLMHQMTAHEDLMKELNLRFSLSAKTTMLLSFYHEEDEDHFPTCLAMVKKVKKSPEFDVVENKLKNTPWLKFVNIKNITETLETNKPNAPACEIPYQIIRAILK